MSDDALAYAAGALLGETRRERVSTVSVTRSSRGTRITIHYFPDEAALMTEHTVLYTPQEVLPLVEEAEQRASGALRVTVGEDLWLVDGELTRALVRDQLTGDSLPGLAEPRPTVLKKGSRWALRPC